MIAACGIMAGFSPYADLPPHLMCGNYGPPSKMDTAIAAFTPNMPWAELVAANGPTIVDMDGQGTSAATPQVARAAALWLRKYKSQLQNAAGWKVVEAVRHALFSSADQAASETKRYLGHGVLKARRAMQVPPDLARPKEREDTASVPFLSVLLNLPAMAEDPRGGMLGIGAMQRSRTRTATRTPARRLFASMVRRIEALPVPAG